MGSRTAYAGQLPYLALPIFPIGLGIVTQMSSLFILQVVTCLLTLQIHSEYDLQVLSTGHLAASLSIAAFSGRICTLLC